MSNSWKNIQSTRLLVLDLLSFARRVPYFPVERHFSLQEVADARRRCGRRISWLTLFTKAYALAAREVPELRCFYSGIPWPRLYQSSDVVTTIAVNRKVEECDQLFFGRLHHSDRKTLSEIQTELEHLTQGDVQEVYRRELRGSKFPTWLRRIGWWWRLNLEPAKRARRLGTGSISVLASQGVLNRRHPSVLTSSLSYGPLNEQGEMWVTLQCDHRVMDGLVAARALNAIKDHLQTSILQELQQMETHSSAAA